MLDEESVVRLTLAVWERFKPWREKVKGRREHWFRDEAAAPTFDKESGIDNDFQTHLLTTTHRALKARLCENHFTTAAEPLSKSDGGKTKAEKLEKVLNGGFKNIETRLGYTLQSALSDAQIADGFGFLMVRRADEVYPPVPEWEYLDELPDPDEEGLEDDERKERKEKRGRYEDEPEEYERKGKKRTGYKERPESYLNRVKEQRAQAGFPYVAEAYDPRSVAFFGDEAGGLAAVVTMQKIPLVKYREKQNGQKFDGKSIQIALSEQDRKLRIYRERGTMPADSDPTLEYTEHVTVACLWTRGEWHEIACLGDMPAEATKDSWQYVKGGEHKWGEPPGVIVPASEFTGETSPERRYLPALHDMYDMKPMTDKAIALLIALSERIVVPPVFIQNVKGLPDFKEDGNPVEFGTPNSLEGADLAPGREIKTLDQNINPAFPQSVELLLQHLKDAAPPTGSFPIEAKTAPWTARLALQEANVYPKQLLTSQILGIEKIATLITQDMSQREETVWVHKKGEDIIGIDPKDITGLKITVDVVKTSSAEKVVEEQRGQELMNDPQFPLTKERGLERYFNVEDPHEQVMEWKAEQMFETYVEPGLMQAEAVKRYGWKAYLTPGMGFVGADGQPRTSQQIVESSDQYSGLGGGGAQAVQPMTSPQGNMPNLSDQNRPNGTMRQPELVG